MQGIELSRYDLESRCTHYCRYLLTRSFPTVLYSSISVSLFVLVLFWFCFPHSTKTSGILFSYTVQSHRKSNYRVYASCSYIISQLSVYLNLYLSIFRFCLFVGDMCNLFLLPIRWYSHTLQSPPSHHPNYSLMIFFLLTVVSQMYDIRVEGNEVYAGNVAYLRCFVPDHVRKYVAVTAWFRGDEEILAELAVMGKYQSEQNSESFNYFHLVDYISSFY